jgi:hypothetical protein
MTARISALSGVIPAAPARGAVIVIAGQAATAARVDRAIHPTGLTHVS